MKHFLFHCSLSHKSVQVDVLGLPRGVYPVDHPVIQLEVPCSVKNHHHIGLQDVDSDIILVWGCEEKHIDRVVLPPAPVDVLLRRAVVDFPKGVPFQLKICIEQRPHLRVLGTQHYTFSARDVGLENPVQLLHFPTLLQQILQARSLFMSNQEEVIAHSETTLDFGRSNPSRMMVCYFIV